MFNFICVEFFDELIVFVEYLYMMIIVICDYDMIIMSVGDIFWVFKLIFFWVFWVEFEYEGFFKVKNLDLVVVIICYN